MVLYPAAGQICGVLFLVCGSSVKSTANLMQMGHVIVGPAGGSCEISLQPTIMAFFICLESVFDGQVFKLNDCHSKLTKISNVAEMSFLLS